jgi:epoxyqueuosine reductase
VMVERLTALHRWIETQVTHSVRGKAYVDTGPVLERDLARRAGLGWFGKNTMLINPRAGSFFFLGALLLELELEADRPFETDHCGRCRRCLDACPTGALVEPHMLDATKCISYLTIELKGAIPLELRERIGALIYGCDVCQEVCPYTRKFSRPLSELAFGARPTIAGKDARTVAREFLGMSPSEFAELFKGSPMKRAKLRGLKRNSAVVLGNVGTSEDVPPLVAALDDAEPLVRAHAAWALSRIGSDEALEALRARLLDTADGRAVVDPGLEGQG